VPARAFFKVSDQPWNAHEIAVRPDFRQRVRECLHGFAQARKRIELPQVFEEPSP
jgi:hypothetical protein